MLVNKNTKETVSYSLDLEENILKENNDWIKIPEALRSIILDNAPYFEFILDEEGNLIDINPTERPEPKSIVPEPTTEEILLQALLEIQQLKQKVTDLEGNL